VGAVERVDEPDKVRIANDRSGPCRLSAVFGRLERPMDDVTALKDCYREAVRHLWNSSFRRQAEAEQDWDLSDRFDDVAALLFQALVLRPLDRDDVEVLPDYRGEREPLPFLVLQVEPRSEIMVNRSQDSGYWDDPLRSVGRGELELQFSRFFDWQVLGFREFGLYRARIVGSEQHPHLVGRDALLPVGASVRVMRAAAERADEPDEPRVR